MVLTTLIFLLLVGINFSPFLRGPADWPPEWRLSYYFVNTLDKVWLPLVIILLILGLFYVLEKKKIKLDSWVSLVLLVSLAYVFQLSVLYFSRHGIFVLIHRVINPDLNGYYTEAVKIKKLTEFIINYQKNVLDLSMHATGHPPGGIIFFWLIEKIISIVPLLKNIAYNLTPSHTDVKLIWNNLTLVQRLTAIVSAFFIPLLGSLNLIPLFYLAKKLFDKITALRSVVLAAFIPALTLFTPLNDVFFPLFFLWSFLFLIKGIKEKKPWLAFYSGIIFSVGLFFTLTILPLIVIYFFYLLANKKLVFPFLFGLFIFHFSLFTLGYNVLTVSYTLMTGLPKGRLYLTWVFYNLYDFFIFTGLPVALTYLSMFTKRIKELLFISFTFVLFLLNFSGAVRGEVGRIWLPLMFPVIMIVGNYLTNKLKVSTKYFLFLLFLQAVQVLVLQEFWVTLW